MKNFTIPPFGTLDLCSLHDNYTTKIDVNGTTVCLDLFFEYMEMSEDQAKAMKDFIYLIPDIDTLNRKYMNKEYFNVEGEIVKEYLYYHLNELEDEELSELIDLGVDAADRELQLYRRLHLCGVGLHSCSESDIGFAAFFEYTACEEFSDCVLVIDTDGFGKPIRLSWEG